jgi:alpha-amylase/alpha-mannosidase (GH57 family)
VTRHVCVHGHFYQPPRENPWLEAIELQDSAYPYHDWNERITEECYAQNAASRVLDESGRIAHIVNNYASISFNIGPTLLAWMERNAPDIHDAIIDADRASAERFDGHGSALAQGYGHIIMPLASPRDRRTQVAWGVADFVHRFGRQPEGMWLPETAVDTDTLEALAEHRIAFTILEPHQAGRVRRLYGGMWTDVSRGGLDTTMPYLVRLPSGAEIAVFFYDGAVSRAVAFEGLLADGAAFAARLRHVPLPDRPGPRLVNIATDGESYGHHHRHGDMALAFVLRRLEQASDVELTNYAAFLAANPPTHEVEIVERTSWSCAHGVERWRSDCGCADGGNPDWAQTWRAPLRDALDWLHDELAPRFEERASKLLRDPWAARDAYVEVVLDRGSPNGERFLREHARRPLDEGERIRVWSLLELQRHAMLMYTSCGWFFDDLGRIETVQVLRYAGRAIELAEESLGLDLEEGFLRRLARARSNRPAVGDGREVYETLVRPSIVGPNEVAAHYAVSSLFERPDRLTRVHRFVVSSQHRYERVAGDAHLAVGRIAVRANATTRRWSLEYAVLHLGDHNLDGGVRESGTDEALEQLHDHLAAPFEVADFPEVIRRLDRAFGERRFSIASLFRDERRAVLDRILDGAVGEATTSYRNIYRQRAPLMRYLGDIGAPIPRPFRLAAEVAVNADLRETLLDPAVDPGRVRSLMADAERWELDLDVEGLARALSRTVERLTDQAARELPEPSLFEHYGPAEEAFFTQARALIQVAEDAPFEVDLARAQNLYYTAVRDVWPPLAERSAAGDATATAWLDQLRMLGESLRIAIDGVPAGVTEQPGGG